MNKIGLLILPFLLLLLSGCAGEYYPISDATMQSGVESTRDASVAKEIAVHQTLRNRDNKYAEAYKTAGTKISFEMVQVSPGIYVQVIKELAMKESPRFDTPLPTSPSEHPLWKTLNTLGGSLIQWTGIFGLANQTAGVLSDSIKNSGTKYEGPYNPQTYNESFNATAEPFVVEPMVITP